MKKLLYLLLMAGVIVSCQSREKRALKLIDKQMFKELYDYKSYEPIETKVDSAYTNPYEDSTVRAIGYRIYAIKEVANDKMDEIHEAQSSMNIWSDMYTSYGSSEYTDAKNKWNEAHDDVTDLIARWKKCNDSIKFIASELPHKFIGWKVTHKFRCKNKGGQPDLATYVYIMDKRMKKVILQYEPEDETEQSLKGLIEDAINPEESK